MIRAALTYIIAGCLLFSCYTEKRAARSINKAAVSYPNLIAKKAELLFPFKPTTDTVTINTSDSAGYKQSMDLLQSQVENYDRFLDSILNSLQPGDTTCYAYKEIIRSLKKQKENLTYQLQHIQPVHDKQIITLPPVEDTRRLFLCEHDKGIALELLAKKTTESDNYEGKAKKRGIIMWSLMGLIVVYCAWEIYGLFKK